MDCSGFGETLSGGGETLSGDGVEGWGEAGGAGEPGDAGTGRLGSAAAKAVLALPHPVQKRCTEEPYGRSQLLQESPPAAGEAGAAAAGAGDGVGVEAEGEGVGVEAEGGTLNELER